MTERVGQQLGNYRLIRLLGAGGFAEVYLGEHILLGTPAAIKILDARLQEQEAEKFRNEARTIARLIHPHIIRLLEFGIDGNIPFMVMDYAPHGSLKDRRPKGTQLPLPTIVSYVKQIADGLQYAHDEKYIHRDIKPANILIGRRNEILLSDFGIAVIAHNTLSRKTEEALGTPSYMAPEQIQKHPLPASDQYALGVIVYQWLSGTLPFEGTGHEVAVKHLSVPPPPLFVAVPTISPAIEQVVMKALAKDPQQRFASVKEFANALEQASIAPAVNTATFPPNPSREPPVPIIIGSQTLQPNEPITPPSQQPHSPAPLRTQSPDLHTSYRGRATARPKGDLPNLQRSATKPRPQSKQSKKRLSTIPLLRRKTLSGLPRWIWQEERIHPGFLWWKLFVVFEPMVMAILVAGRLFLDRSLLKGDALVWASFLTMIQGYSLLALVIVFMAKLDCENQGRMLTMGFGGTFTGALPFFVSLGVFKGIFPTLVGNLVLGLSFAVQAGMSGILLTTEEDTDNSLTETTVPAGLWILCLVPPVLLQLYCILYVVFGVTGKLFWLFAVVALLGVSITGAFFVILGKRWHRFYVIGHELLAEAAAVLDGISLLFFVIALIFGNAWLLGGLFVQCIASAVLIPVRWKKKRMHYAFR